MKALDKKARTNTQKELDKISATHNYFAEELQTVPDALADRIHSLEV